MKHKSKKTKPLKPLSDGRDESGKFTKNNSFGRGNPLSKQINELRVALVNRVTPSDIEAIIDKLLEQAKDGDSDSIRIIFDRTLGRPMEFDVLQKIEELEVAINEIQNSSK